MKIAVRSRPPLARLALALALVIPALAAGAQEAPPPTSQAEPAPPSRPAGPADDLERGVPRTAMKGYLQACRAGDFELAARYLDLRRLSDAERSERGPELARQLKFVLDQKLWVDWESLSDDPNGERDDGLSASRDRVGSIETRMGPVPVLLQRVPREDGAPIWKISSATVAATPDLYDEFGYGPLEELLPDWLLSITLLELALWQWLAVLVLAVLAGVLSWLVVFALFKLVRPLVARSRTDFDDRLLRATAGPLRLLVAIGVFAAGTAPLGFGLLVQRFFDALERGLLIVAFAWFLLKIVNIFTLVAWSRLRERGDQATASVVPLGQKAVKVVILLVAVLAILDSFGINVTAVVAGLGVGGIAVALAAQKTIENLFGGVTVLADKPVSVGDFCRFGDRVGTVEEIGLRSTRVRTLDRTLVSIPNASFSSMELENFAVRDKIWYHPRIGLRYETNPEQLRYVLVEIRKMLYAHPRVLPDPARIRFVEFGAYSLDLDIFAYVSATDYGEYLEVAEDLNLRIMDIVEASGSGFAFPSQTLYVEKDAGLDPEHARAAEQEVKAWRERRELFLPKFPPEKISELADTLEYPVAGSPDHRAGASRGED